MHARMLGIPFLLPRNCTHCPSKIMFTYLTQPKVIIATSAPFLCTLGVLVLLVLPVQF